MELEHTGSGLEFCCLGLIILKITNPCGGNRMMTGKELLSSLDGVRRFYSDLGQLFLTADACMEERGWKALGDATCIFHTSASINSADRWVPRVAARQYGSDENALGITAMITAILDKPDSNHPIAEPIITGAYFVLPSNNSIDAQKVPYWHAWWGAWRLGSSTGEPETITNQDGGWKDDWRFTYMQVFARPLVDIASSDSLQSKIISPLLNLIKAYQSV